MGRLSREKESGATALGPVDEWPKSLKTAAGMMIRQGIAQILCWGPERLQIYNDAYRVIMGNKHPEGLSRSVLAHSHLPGSRPNGTPDGHGSFSLSGQHFRDLC